VFKTLSFSVFLVRCSITWILMRTTCSCPRRRRCVPGRTLARPTFPKRLRPCPRPCPPNGSLHSTRELARRPNKMRLSASAPSRLARNTLRRLLPVTHHTPIRLPPTHLPLCNDRLLSSQRPRARTPCVRRSHIPILHSHRFIRITFTNAAMVTATETTARSLYPYPRPIRCPCSFNFPCRRPFISLIPAGRTHTIP
jgi:hypothetical protein